MLTALAAVCSFLVVMPGNVTVTAYYSHEHPPGYTYKYDTYGYNPGMYKVDAEGHPNRIEARQNGVIVGRCVYDESVFSDGFESGDTSEWGGW